MSRKYALDLLKIVACMAVIGQHNVSLDPSLPLKLWGENFFIYYLCRFAVPIFVMISGILLLDPKHPLSHKKNMESLHTTAFDRSVGHPIYR